MKVLFDNQICLIQKFGGVSRYFFELKKGLSDHAAITNLFSKNIYFKGESELIGNESSIGLIKKVGYSYSKFKNQRHNIKKIKQGAFDVFHPTYYDPYFLPYLSKPLVLTVYDMTHEKYPEYFPANDVTSKNKRILCHAATKILAISQSTKDDLVELFNIAPEKVEVTYLAGGLVNNNVKVELPERYILFVGNRTGYKNFELFYQAVLPILENDPLLHVVCTGPNFTQEESLQFETDAVSERLHQMFAKEEEFYTIYNRALFFVFPSLYEGFGIPVLEAMSASCPIVLSNTSSLPEVAGNAALYFDPMSREDLNSKMNQLLASPEGRNELINKGKKQLEEFSWQKTTSETTRIYHSIINEKP